MQPDADYLARPQVNLRASEFVSECEIACESDFYNAQGQSIGQFVVILSPTGFHLFIQTAATRPRKGAHAFVPERAHLLLIPIATRKG